MHHCRPRPYYQPDMTDPIKSLKYMWMKLEHGPDEERNRIFELVKDQAYTLITSSEGSLVIQRFFQFGSDAHKRYLAMSIWCNVLTLSLNEHGSKVIVAALENSPTYIPLKIARELHGYVCKAARHPYGNIVIGKCIDILDPSALCTFMHELREEMVSLANHKYGNYVVTRILEKPGNLWSDVVSKLEGQVLKCARNEHGNYVLQKVVDCASPASVRQIFTEMKPDIVALAMDKYGSHLLQHMVEHAPYCLQEINDALDEFLVECAMDQYGNYVLQKCLQCTPPSVVLATIIKVQKAIMHLATHKFGSRLIYAILEMPGDLWIQVGEVLQNNLIECSLNQFGCHLVQLYLKRVNPKMLQSIFEQMQSSLLELSTSKYGSYVIETMLASNPFMHAQYASRLGKNLVYCAKDDHATYIVRKCIECHKSDPNIWRILKGYVFELAVDKNGVLVLQCAIDKYPDARFDVLASLQGRVEVCAMNKYASHGLQKLIRFGDPQSRQTIINELRGKVKTLSTNQYGCYIIEEILTSCPYEQRRPVIQEILDHVRYIISNQFGNYIIQQLLRSGRPEDKTRIISSIKDQVVPMCENKFASTVVIKSISHMGRDAFKMLEDEVKGLPERIIKRQKPSVYHAVESILAYGRSKSCRRRGE